MNIFKKSLTMICLLALLTVFCSCNVRKDTQKENIPESKQCKEILDNQLKIATSKSESELRMYYQMSLSMEKPVYYPNMSFSLVFEQKFYLPQDAQTYMLDVDHPVAVYHFTADRYAHSLYAHMIYEKKGDEVLPAPIEDLDNENWVFSGKYILTSNVSASADASLLKEGASIKELSEKFPELCYYCNFPRWKGQTVGYYPSPAILMTNQGFFLLETELASDENDVLIKSVTRKDSLTYQDVEEHYSKATEFYLYKTQIAD